MFSYMMVLVLMIQSSLKIPILFSIIIFSSFVIILQFSPDALAVCGKTCREAEARGMTIQEYLDAVKGGKISTSETKSTATSTATGEISQKEILKAISAKNFISIRVSTSCKNIDYCPKIKDLADAFDNSNRYLSGDFYYDEAKKQWARSPPKVYNVFEMYKYIDGYNWQLWVEPDDYTWKRSKQIQIVPHLNYLDDRDIIEYRTRTEYKGLFLDECARAIIGWKDNGEKILLDVLNHFYSNCAEPVKYDPEVEIFLGSTIFTDCDKECFYLKEQYMMQDKAYYQTEKAFADAYKGKEKTSGDKPCYGIYCNKVKTGTKIPTKDPRTIEEKVKELELKEEVRKEKLKDLEFIQICEKFKRDDPDEARGAKVDCKDKDKRIAYIKLRESK